MKPVYLLTGKPGTGKTSLIKETVADLEGRAGGFYTEEIRSHGTRLGFRLITLDGYETILAHTDFNKRFQVGKYGVDVESLDRVGVSALRKAAEQCDLVVIDEIGKIAGTGAISGPDVSREGVQRDLLPIVEGYSVMTKYGLLKTNHILFIAAGAFHNKKPSDLIPEMQGRFPIRVELSALTEKDFQKILVEPENSLIKQYIALLATEGITLKFTGDAIEAIAHIAAQVNESTENIGARRLHTIMTKLLEELLYAASQTSAKSVIITECYVKDKLESIVRDVDVSRYIL